MIFTRSRTMFPDDLIQRGHYALLKPFSNSLALIRGTSTLYCGPRSSTLPSIWLKKIFLAVRQEDYSILWNLSGLLQPSGCTLDYEWTRYHVSTSIVFSFMWTMSKC